MFLTLLGGCFAGTDTSEGSSDGLAQESAPDLDGAVVVASDGGVEPAVDAGPPPNVVVLRDDTGAQVGQISARGRGCPLGGWDAEMAPDGLSFTVTFDALRIQLAPTQELATSGCTLTISPPSAVGRQFSADTLAFSGEARLDEGVVGALELRHFVDGSRANTAHGHAHEEGPFEGTISLTREVPEEEARWTPCTGRARGVNVDLLLRLSNTFPRASGTLHGDIEAGSKLSIKLATRRCPAAASAR